MPAQERVTVGLVRGLHGLRGALRVEVLSDDPERFAVGSVLFADGDTQPLTITWVGAAKTGLLVSFEGFHSREAAEPLRDRYLEAIVDEPLPEGSWYWHDIRGLTVTTVAGDELGKVSDVFRAGEGEVYIVQGGPLGELMVPAVKDVVVELDPPAGRLVVDPVVLDLPDKPPRRRKRHENTRRSRKTARAERAAKARAAADSATSARPETAEAPVPGTSDVPDVPDVPDAADVPDASEPPPALQSKAEDAS